MNQQNLMHTCWRNGYKTSKIIEEFSNNGYDISSRDVQHLFKWVVEKHFKENT